jgi:hypothetical protein
VHRDAKALSDEHGQLASHQASAHQANERDGCRFDVGNSDWSFGAFLNEVEGVERCGKLGAQGEVGEGLVLGGKDLGQRQPRPG